MDRRNSRELSSFLAARTAWVLWHERLARLIAYGVSQNDPHCRPGDAPDLNADDISDLQVVLARLARLDSAHANMAATLAHELAHAVTHDAYAEMPQDVRDVVAESVAYAVCSRFGLDLTLRSVDYVAGWGHPQGHDPEAFHVDMAATHDGAASLIDAIAVAMSNRSEAGSPLSQQQTGAAFFNTCA
jgi:hypothetical protein